MTAMRVEDVREWLLSQKSKWMDPQLLEQDGDAIPDVQNGNKFWRFNECLDVMLQIEVTNHGCRLVTYDAAGWYFVSMRWTRQV